MGAFPRCQRRNIIDSILGTISSCVHATDDYSPYQLHLLVMGGGGLGVPLFCSSAALRAETEKLLNEAAIPSVTREISGLPRPIDEWTCHLYMLWCCQLDF